MYGEEAPKEIADFKTEELAAEPEAPEEPQPGTLLSFLAYYDRTGTKNNKIRSRASLRAAEPSGQSTEEPFRAERLPDAFLVGQTEGQVSTFDDDDDDLEIRLDKVEPPDPDEEVSKVCQRTQLVHLWTCLQNYLIIGLMDHATGLAIYT